MAWLTADVDALLEGLVYLGIHLDVKVLLLGHNMITVSYCLPDPIMERIADNGVSDIAEPCARNLEDVTLVWDVEWSSLVLVDLLQYELHLETLVLGHTYHLDVVALDTMKPIVMKW